MSAPAGGPGSAVATQLARRYVDRRIQKIVSVSTNFWRSDDVRAALTFTFSSFPQRISTLAIANIIFACEAIIVRYALSTSVAAGIAPCGFAVIIIDAALSQETSAIEDIASLVGAGAGNCACAASGLPAIRSAASATVAR
ncbi:MAG: hypothetical protein NVSMB64_05500 [Candidatus Velthaea sp.]